MSDLDEQSKQRLVGAAIWLLLLVIIVPMWYSNPVNFSPDGVSAPETSSLPTIEHAYRLPQGYEAPVTNGQAKFQQQSTALATNQTSMRIASDNSESPVSSGVTAEENAVLDVIMPQFADNISGDDRYAGQWIVRLQAFNNTKQANDLATKIKNKLQQSYPVYIKYFEKTRVYSVRTGPYNSRAKADKALEKLDKILRTDGEVKQLPKNE